MKGLGSKQVKSHQTSLPVRHRPDTASQIVRDPEPQFERMDGPVLMSSDTDSSAGNLAGRMLTLVRVGMHLVYMLPNGANGRSERWAVLPQTISQTRRGAGEAWIRDALPCAQRS